MAYEALYRRYRPSRFEDAFFGQAHVVAALRNAVEGDRVGHAYLFSGPRGTGKTTSARILAKALNCTNLQGGEPCDECESCEAFNSGGSYDLHELDAASNNGVDAMRDLIGKVALGSPGRTKVYILDEAHMLTGGAENALLKTLEEPPPHVVFVLCTTEPNKVVPTIRSRTQHLEFSLLNQTEVGELVDHVVAEAGLEITDDDRAYVIRAGGGSARDTLSALDQVVAAGGAPQGGEHLEALFQALIDRDSVAALTAIDGALQSGRDAAGVATSLLADLRNVFLARMRVSIDHLPEAERVKAEQRAQAMPPARVTRAVEVIGASVIEMRQAPDPRVDLEVAIIRLTRPDLDIAPEALLERIEALEQGSGVAVAAPAPQSQPQQPPAGSPAEAIASASSATSESESPTTVSPVASESSSAEPPTTVPANDPRPAVPPTAGKRGADMVRAVLAAHDSPEPGSDQAPVSMAVEAARADLSDAPKLSKTLADVRAERRAGASVDSLAVAEAPAAADESVATEAPAVSDPPVATEAPAVSDPPVATEAPAVSDPVASEARAVVDPPVDDDAGANRANGAAQPVTGESTDTGERAAARPVAAPSSGDDLTLEAIEAAWENGILESLSGRARSRFSAGRFLPTSEGAIAFGLPNPVHRDRCEEVRVELDDALAAHFGRPIPLELVVDTAESEPDIFGSTPPETGDGQSAAPDLDEEVVDMDGLTDATDQASSGVDRVLATFEGSEVIEEHPATPSGDGR